jgi:hypothetical protein
MSLSTHHVGGVADPRLGPTKPLRTILVAFVILIVAGTIASAATGGTPTETPSVTVSPEPTESPSATESPSPEPTETPSPESSEAKATKAEASSDEGGPAPDFSACAGLHGLDNAICRHEALLAVHPNNPGLNNSLGRLQANLAAHAGSTHGNSESHRHSESDDSGL